MKAKHARLTVVTAGCLAVSLALLSDGAPLPEVVGVLPHPLSTVAQYNPRDNRFYGRLREAGADFIASIDERGRVTRIRKLPDLDGWIPGAAVLVASSQVLHFLTVDDEGLHRLNTLGLETGDLVSQRLPVPVKVLVGNPTEINSLFGIYRSGASDRLVQIDTSNGGLKEVMDLASLGSVFDATIVDPEEAEILVIGTDDEAEFALFSIDLKASTTEPIESVAVGTDQVVVTRPGTGAETAAVFTVGTQSCTAIAGLDPATGVVFVAHFRSDYVGVEEEIDRIAAQVGELGVKGGLESMTIAVAGGVRGDPQSIDNLRQTYRSLVETHRVKAEAIAKFNSGTSHNMVVYKDALLVF